MGFVISAALILTGCSVGESVEKQLSDVLSGMYTAEQEYRDVQAEVSKLEKSEQELFTNVMKLTQGDKEELEVKVSELNALLDERVSYIDEEEASMKKANKFAESLDEIIIEADDDNYSKISELKKAVSERYELHSTFIAEYKKLVDFQKNLYAMLIDEATELPKLKDKVEEVNAQNQAVQLAINAFNESTGIVNGLKDDLFTSLEEDN